MWNEPDHCCSDEPEPKGQLHAGIKCSPASYNLWYDALSQGLKAADSKLLFGGPNTGGGYAETEPRRRAERV